MRAQNKCEIHNFLLTGVVSGKKNVTGTTKVFKNDQQLLGTRGYPYFLFYEMEVASLFNTFLVVSKSCLDCILANQRKAVRDAKRVVSTILLLKIKYSKRGFYVTIYHEVLRCL